MQSVYSAAPIVNIEYVDLIQDNIERDNVDSQLTFLSDDCRGKKESLSMLF